MSQNTSVYQNNTVRVDAAPSQRAGASARAPRPLLDLRTPHPERRVSPAGPRVSPMWCHGRMAEGGEGQNRPIVTRAPRRAAGSRCQLGGVGRHLAQQALLLRLLQEVERRNVLRVDKADEFFCTAIS